MAATRSGQSLAVLTRALITRSMESSRGATRNLSGGKGKILSEEERAAENVYIQKVRRSLAMFDHSS
ncbi:hypothetical protein D8674_030475 [Pyrus ussuriensis x Pyrus communis]|uniref:Uncharacterized protein n=1 Tax=Pyrus ussuriensis x Pyrus communis TaxID=2448454 RepID=A0A5N5EW77_9ROSA|nr:hypothetical protein D8674_030475 [Pyrus ussuriensis x Pyrus communis]